MRLYRYAGLYIFVPEVDWCYYNIDLIQIQQKNQNKIQYQSTSIFFIWYIFRDDAPISGYVKNHQKKTSLQGFWGPFQTDPKN